VTDSLDRAGGEGVSAEERRRFGGRSLCVGVALLLLLFLAHLDSWNPAGFFGWYQDDTILFSSARSLAQGRGYSLPSFPLPSGGVLPQSKYPILYPWLLSWIWRFNPAFPSNITGAVWMTALFACWYLVASFLLLRRLGWSDWPALLLAGLTAFHPNFVFLGGAVLSEMLFMALAMTAVLVSDSAFREKRATLAVLAAVVGGLSVMTRVFGVAVIAGIAAHALYRRTVRLAAVFCLVAAPFVIFALWPAIHPPVDAPSSDGWRQTFLYYTSYWQFWRLCVPNWHVFLAMLAFNVQAFLESPSSYCLFPPLGDHSYFGFLLSVTLTAGILAGVGRQGRKRGWSSIHFVFPLYAALTLIWNYTLMDRFLLLFVPMFYAGLATEVRHLGAMLAENLRSQRSTGEKILAGVLGLALVALGGLAVRHYGRGLRKPAALNQGAAVAGEKQEAYRWIRDNTNPRDRFIAYEDASLYLFTDRQAIRPIVFSTEAFFQQDERVLRRDLAHFTDVAQQVRARYWLAAEDDFHLETGLPLIQEKVSQLRAILPAVFRSNQSKVQIYDLCAAPLRLCGDSRR